MGEKDNCIWQSLVPNNHLSSISVLMRRWGMSWGLMTDQRKGAEGKVEPGYVCSLLSGEAPAY